MPQTPTQRIELGTHRSGAFQLAQGETSGGKLEGKLDGKATTHTETAEAERSPGEVPDPYLLFWNSLVVAALMIVFALAVRRRMEKVPRGVQNFGEWVVEFINDQLTVPIIGESGKKYTPLVGTVFVYVVLMNLIGLVPGFHSPTANITITLALGVVVFLYSQWEGIRQNGIGGHLMHFMGPKLGKYPLLFPLMLPVELISEFVRPFTLAVRLFGNIFGEDVIIIVLTGLAGSLAGSALGWFPTQFPLLLLGILTAGVQAFVFAMLTCIYISLASHHDEGEHGEEGPVSGTGHAHAAGH
jgi:F-type H+-transporting ATPase subunit a